MTHWMRSREAAAADGMLIAYYAAHAPERMAVAAPAGDRTFAELNARINQLARVLRSHGLGPGSAVAAICGNRAEFLEVHGACMRTGMRFTPANWHLTGEEMAYIVSDCEAEALIADSRFAPAACEALAASPNVRLALAIDGAGDDAIDDFDDYAAALGGVDANDLSDPELGGPMLYTSGTTGHPKGVLRWPPKAGGLAGALAEATVRLDPTCETGLVTGPLYHAAPLNLNAVPTLYQGAGLVLMDRFDAEEMLRLIERYRVAFSHLVATMFHRMLRLPDGVRSRYDLSSLRALLHGAAPCPVHVKQAVIDWLGPVVYEYYAATEGGATLVDSADWMQRPGTVGRAIEGAEVRVLDDAGGELATGEVGTVYFRAPPGGRFEYFKAPEKTAGAYHGDFFTMGDHGYVDRDGYLFLTGRSAEIINAGGVNIYPQEVDDVLLGAPEVLDVCTVGVPNDEWGEEVKSVVELTHGTSPDPALAERLITLCREHLAAYKCPRSIDFERDLPRLPSGKIQRHKVRARYWQGRTRSI